MTSQVRAASYCPYCDTDANNSDGHTIVQSRYRMLVQYDCGTLVLWVCQFTKNHSEYEWLNWRSNQSSFCFKHQCINTIAEPVNGIDIDWEDISFWNVSKELEALVL